jgi:pyruvate,water dikinase
MIRRITRALLTFLEVIGLKRDDTVDQAMQVARLRLYHTEFRKLISANNSFLETIADLEHKRINREFIDRSFLKRKVLRAMADIHAMVESLNVISHNHYPGLRNALERISQPLMALFTEENTGPSHPVVLEMSSLNRAHGDLYGGKMANLGEIHNHLGLPVPDGFVVTTDGFRLLIEEGGVRSWIQDQDMELLSTQDIEGTSRAIQERLLNLSVPKTLEKGILGQYQRLVQQTGSTPPMAVRSSAVGEDSDFSFAGQFLSLLQVKREELVPSYLKVVASLYSPEAIQYRLLHGIPGESAEMAVGFIPMVNALVSGVAFSKDPSQPESGQVLIQAVRGLAVPLVEGRTSPEIILVSYPSDPPQISRTPSHQETRMFLSPEGEIREEPILPEEARIPFLSEEDAIQLAGWALDLEAHFACPQDIEWAKDQEGRIIILQSRPLRLAQGAVKKGAPLPGYPLLVTNGEVACPGVGKGVAVHLGEDEDLGAFPEGGVLVAKRSSPKYVRLMAKAKAIVTDYGSTTGHMASLAREFRVPTLLNTRVATQAIPNGERVTVDATKGLVYQGEVPVPEEEILTFTKDIKSQPPLSPEYHLLQKVVDLVHPLYLTDPRAGQFQPEGCRTLHDLARYIHEKSYREMFMMGQNVGDMRSSSLFLDIFLPIDLYLIDLGGGLKGTPHKGKVKRSQVVSVPFAALLKGMLHEKIPRFGARPIDLKGLAAIMLRHAMSSPESEQTFRDPCYAILSDNYLNYTARVGYHFSVVDTYCSSTPNKNYISLTFRGGAADYVRRSRRARAIGEILREYGFSVEITHDGVNARLSKSSREETISHLEMIGSLFQFFRQMDAAMTSDETVELYKKAFLKGDYDLKETF